MAVVKWIQPSSSFYSRLVLLSLVQEQECRSPAVGTEHCWPSRLQGRTGAPPHSDFILPYSYTQKYHLINLWRLAITVQFGLTVSTTVPLSALPARAIPLFLPE